jgi:hypothetical protein
MEKLYNEFKDKDFTILAIDMQEDADSVKVFREKYNSNNSSINQYTRFENNMLNFNMLSQ